MRIDSPISTNAQITGSFSGSFYGDGSGMSGVTAEWDGSHDGDASITGSLNVSANVIVGGTVDGRDIATDGSKLDGIESGATADQTAAEIKTAYESNADTNEFSDAEKSNLAAIEAGATGDLTGAEIKALYEAEADTNAYDDAAVSKLAGIEANADVTDATNVEAAGALMDSEVTDLAGIKSVTISTLQPKLAEGAFVDGDKTKLDGLEAGAEVNVVTSVASKTGDVELVKGDVGLGNVDNTSDADKPVSTATQTALDTKVSTDSAQALSSAGNALTLDGNTLTLTRGDASTDTIDLSAYLDEDSRSISSGVLDGPTGIVTFTRDDTTTFTLDLSDLLDDTNLVTSVNGAAGVVVLDADDISDATTTNKFTTAENLTKLAGIEAGATADQTDAEIETAYNNQVGKVSAAEITAGTEAGVRRYSPADIVSLIDTHQTDTVYSHPTHPGDDASVDTGALTGAKVISDLDFNINTDSLGHVTDANATVATRDLTLADLGYTGDTDANNYTLPLGSSTVRGGFKIGYAENGKNYPVEISSEKMYVNVPWTDTNTTYTRADFINQDVNTDSTVEFAKVTVDASSTTGLYFTADPGGGSGDLARIRYYATTGEATKLHLSVANDADDVIHLDAEGGTDVSNTLRVTGDVIAYHSSDERLKDNIIPIEGALEKVEKLGGYEFDWNDKQKDYEGHDIGVIAQEVEAIFPELVATRDNGFKAVKYEKLTAVLLQAVKELSEKVKQLENK